MANAAIAYLNIADLGRFSVISSQVLTLPASNMLVEHVQRRWRSLTNADFVILDLLSSQTFDTIAVLGMTMSASGLIRVRASNTDPNVVSSPVFESGNVAVSTSYNSYIALMSPAITARWIRIDLADSGGPGYVEAGRVFVGSRTSFTHNFSYGWQRAWVDRSIRNKTRGGQTQIWHDNMYRVLDVSFVITASERTGLVETIDLVNGQKTDVLFVTDTASSNLPRDSIWGLMSELTPVAQPYFDLSTKQLKIEERL